MAVTTSLTFDLRVIEFCFVSPNLDLQKKRANMMDLRKNLYKYIHNSITG